MTKDLSRKLSNVFMKILPLVIRTQLREQEVYRPRNPRGMRTFVLMILQVILKKLAEWEVLVVSSSSSPTPVAISVRYCETCGRISCFYFLQGLFSGCNVFAIT